MSLPWDPERADHCLRIRQYRLRITQWKLDKNIKSEEMQAIVKKRQTRKLLERGKAEQVFRVRGTEVETQKIDRWMKSHDITDSMLYAPSQLASKSGVPIRRVCIDIDSV
jgi:hypothetical protein